MMNARVTGPVLLSMLLIAAVGSGSYAAGGNVAKGKVLYTNLCIRCHGVDGKGDAYMKFNPPVADLSSPAVQSKLDESLMKAIHDGRKDTAMGAWKFVLSEEEISDVTAYVRVLGSHANRTLP
ncbi:MAG TPA: cytochrome c [Nitrospira sp.]|jgi:mono/diheme cytochrome c family protein|uniref:c-type cytochrome n=1 Tax=Nitrospira sp. ND1 TaxID=1658518 RepID=UPI0013565795|nr:cytochrome c [Nitrospira sp. ND1]MBK7417924.1 c-type cytochrome [Nitrospira sp.]MBK9995855.1 c-type cytochrome [Nitrospira sp.]MBP6198988.1 c-type cytochrome [Nitrospira sp.]MBP6204500.1 c-type cytochrome [Nitrospira sp.]HQW91171.1 cytochrome c [Nitrospira sp.]